VKLELAIVSDTHWHESNQDLERLVHRLYGAQFILHAGDVVSPVVVSALETVAPVLAVVGNCCQAALRERFPLQRVEEFSGLQVGMLHGHLVNLEDPDAIVAKFPAETRLCIHGHTHLARNQLCGDVWIFNPGSVSQPRWGSPPTYGWATWEDGKLLLEHRMF